jgi:hypothetical protein
MCVTEGEYEGDYFFEVPQVPLFKDQKWLKMAKIDKNANLHNPT